MFQDMLRSCSITLLRNFYTVSQTERKKTTINAGTTRDLAQLVRLIKLELRPESLLAQTDSSLADSLSHFPIYYRNVYPNFVTMASAATVDRFLSNRFLK